MIFCFVHFDLTELIGFVLSIFAYNLFHDFLRFFVRYFIGSNRLLKFFKLSSFKNLCYSFCLLFEDFWIRFVIFSVKYFFCSKFSLKLRKTLVLLQKKLFKELIVCLVCIFKSFDGISDNS